MPRVSVRSHPPPHLEEGNGALCVPGLQQGLSAASHAQDPPAHAHEGEALPVHSSECHYPYPDCRKHVVSSSKVREHRRAPLPVPSAARPLYTKSTSLCISASITPLSWCKSLCGPSPARGLVQPPSISVGLATGLRRPPGVSTGKQPHPCVQHSLGIMTMVRRTS